MLVFYRLIKDFWNTALVTWLILVIMELFNPGTVARLINLEYWFYFLFFSYLAIILLKKPIFRS
ncbi:MAG: hypothetical protein C3F02_04910 [Parcubacteria group bacterium]|nr:MAG: hypothetical protein C3F02_04910 [Parcubacteria group bacterium]